MRTDSSDPFYKVYWFRVEPTEGVTNLYENTNDEILIFHRHFPRNTMVYFKMINDVSEIEMIGARKFEQSLPYILKMLLKEYHMHKNGPYVLILLNVFIRIFKFFIMLRSVHVMCRLL